ncbi:uncharacterized protein BDW70DRAFT_33921 [Aspergillus foveolatus]|uniref:uncharacterized protein n=1 Tax=Aspergillus foveolatus TaxID=210207 RepID=UPI003CCCAFD9
MVLFQRRITLPSLDTLQILCSRRAYQALGVMAQWRAGGTLPIPGAGIAYTPLQLDRSKYAYLNDFPNTLPTDIDVPGIFLTPQARYTISGYPWGLRLSYNCSMVTVMSELTILPRRDDFVLEDRDRLASLYEPLDGQSTKPKHGEELITAANSTVPLKIFAYIEQGTNFRNIFREAQRS